MRSDRERRRRRRRSLRGAKAALAFAYQEARLREATLRAVHAWQFGYIGYTGFEGAVPPVVGDIHELHVAA